MPESIYADQNDTLSISSQGSEIDEFLQEDILAPMRISADDEEEGDQEALSDHPEQRVAEPQVSISQTQYRLLKTLTRNLTDTLHQINILLNTVDVVRREVPEESEDSLVDVHSDDSSSTFGVTVIEGVFDGKNMVGPDGRSYEVPLNYASKSKLVEGDMMKLTIDRHGSYIYKQIGPIQRSRIVASLDYDPLAKQYLAIFGEQRWNLLSAAVTYYHGEVGDEVVVLVPQESVSHWAAVENIIKIHRSSTADTRLSNENSIGL
jgi:hypothetical protein